jgi:hypothetical protein
VEKFQYEFQRRRKNQESRPTCPDFSLTHFSKPMIGSGHGAEERILTANEREDKSGKRESGKTKDRRHEGHQFSPIGQEIINHRGTKTDWWNEL